MTRPLRNPCLIAASLLAGCLSWSAPPEQDEQVEVLKPAAAGATQGALRETLLETALGQIGRPYRYGGGDGEGFDCSGLARHVYAEAGIALPRTAAEQRRAGRPIDLANAMPGDLVFFQMGSGTHVGIYVGDGRVVHAPARGKEVTVTSVTTPYWKQRLAAVVRILE
jgi:cell wall-associated NlpC family hydrolase